MKKKVLVKTTRKVLRLKKIASKKKSKVLLEVIPVVAPITPLVILPADYIKDPRVQSWLQSHPIF